MFLRMLHFHIQELRQTEVVLVCFIRNQQGFNSLFHKLRRFAFWSSFGRPQMPKFSEKSLRVPSGQR